MNNYLRIILILAVTSISFSSVGAQSAERTGTVIIVGKRLSAGQTLVELVDAGFEVAVSHRSPIHFGPGPLALKLFFRILVEIEAFQLWRHGTRAPGWDVKMQGGRPRQLIEQGMVKTFSGLRRFEESSVVFEGGTSLRPSAVIYATGFRPALDHLRSILPELAAGQPMPALRSMDSVAVPGLYFVGLDHLRNFQSRFLRGIRKDVVILANQLLSKRPGRVEASRTNRVAEVAQPTEIAP